MRYFTFEIDGQQVGYYEESDENGVLYANARMVLEGEAFENPFWVRHADGLAVAYRFGEEDWIPCDAEDDVYPTAATPLLVARAAAGESVSYRQLHEGKGTIIGPARLEQTDDGCFQEIVNEMPCRSFVWRDGAIVAYHWGGTACSHICPDRASAVAGTRWADQAD